MQKWRLHPIKLNVFSADKKLPHKMNVEALTEQRGSVYGHPMADFTCVQDMYAIWEARRAAGHPSALGLEYEKALRHSVYLMLVKLSRLGQTPDHLDSVQDIAGYAKCLERCIEHETP